MGFFSRLLQPFRSHGLPAMVCRPEAWSQGQIRSKLWLVEKLEKCLPSERPLVIWMLGGWYGMTGFLILSRQRVSVDRICSLDVDAEANSVARQVNASWTFDPIRFQAFEADCEKLDFREGPFGPAPDVIINTAMEHFSADWLERVPEGTWLALQSTDMPDPEHTHLCRSLDEFRRSLEPHMNFEICEEMKFSYPQLKFSRFLAIGRARNG